MPLSKALGTFDLSATSSDGKLPMEDTTCYSGPRQTGIYSSSDKRPDFSLNGDLSRLSERTEVNDPNELEGVPEC